MPANTHALGVGLNACETKTLISRQITPADQFLTPDSQMWTSKL